MYLCKNSTLVPEIVQKESDLTETDSIDAAKENDQQKQDDIVK
jgi:hypothetical protein